jgi:hypothetical protein
MTEDDKLFLTKILKKHFVLYKMKDSEILKIVCKMKFCSCDKGKFVIKQGDVGSLFFILRKIFFAIINFSKKQEK